MSRVSFDEMPKEELVELLRKRGAIVKQVEAECRTLEAKLQNYEFMKFNYEVSQQTIQVLKDIIINIKRSM